MALGSNPNILVGDPSHCVYKLTEFMNVDKRPLRHMTILDKPRTPYLA